MRFPVCGGSFGRSWDIGRVAVVPGISLVRQVVEGDDSKYYAERGDAPSSYGGHHRFVDGIGLVEEGWR